MAARVHSQLKFIAFNANGAWRQHYELNKQLQDLHIDVTLPSETHLKPHEGFFISLISKDTYTSEIECRATGIMRDDFQFML
jgi:hypothetical protein